MPSRAQRDLIDEFDLTEDEARAITSLRFTFGRRNGTAIVGHTLGARK